MIIYGSRSSHVKTVQLQTETCTHCNTQGSLIMSTYARYGHVFWIPLFSLGRISVSECQHCRQVLELKQMPAQIRAYHERNLAETRVPLWQFSGLALFALAIVAGIYTNNQDKKQQAQFLESPLAGDVYEYKTGERSYTLFKIDEVISDTLVVRFNDYQVDKLSGLYSIDKEENYSDSTYIIPKAELMEMFASGSISDINRNP